MDKNKEHQEHSREATGNTDQQAVDKAPGEERGEAEKVTNEDLKGKKVDRDPEEGDQ